jgi:16S rRNA (guanine966-N2)-methyltransferase
MKIISGKYAGRKIITVGKTRPPLVRIRQNIFDLLPDLEGFTVLDLCAGSGSLGLEAISRGAKMVYFFEEDREVAQNLIQTLKKWGITNAQVAMSNVQYLPHAKVKVDLVFFDPPFGHNYVKEVCTKVLSKGWTTPETILVVRTNERQANMTGWIQIHSKAIGASHTYFYYREDSPKILDIVDNFK